MAATPISRTEPYVVALSLEVGRHRCRSDGHHRVCASFHSDENADIPCRTAVAEQTG